MTDTIVGIGCAIGGIALCLGIWAAWRRGQYTLLAGINGVAALIALIVSGRHLRPAILYNETPMLLFFALEASIVIVFAIIMFGLRVPRFVIVSQAATNGLLLALLGFVLISFRFTRFI